MCASRDRLPVGGVTAFGPWMRVALVTSGVVEISGMHGPLRVHGGELVVVPAGRRGFVRAVEDLDWFVVILDEAFVVDLLAWTGSCGGLHQAWRPGERSAMYRVRLTPYDVASFEGWFVEAVAAIRTRTPLLAISAALTLLARVEPLVAREGGLLPSWPAPLRREVAEAERLMTEDYARAWTVPKLAARVGLSASALTRAFRAGLGVSPAAYLRQVRLARFTSLLTTTDLGVAEAAWRVGWTSPSQARQLTIRQFGATPSTLRRRQREAEPDRSE